MKITDISVSRPVTVSMVVAALIVFGLVSLGRLRVELLPNISYPSLTIQTEYRDAAPAEVEQFVTRPIEEAVGVLPGLEKVRSVSRPGQSEVTLEYVWRTKMDLAALDVREKLDLIELPEAAGRPAILRFDPSLDPVMRLRIAGGEDLLRLRRIADKLVKKELEGLKGVAAAKVSGGLEEEIHIDIDKGRLAALGIPITQVTARLRSENVNVAGGSLTDEESEYLVRTTSEFTTVEEMARVHISNVNGRPILLGDVAAVEAGHKERDVIAKLDGKESVEVAIYKEGDANTVSVAKAVRKKLSTISLPKGVTSTVASDHSIFVQRSVSEVMRAAILGGLLATLVLYLFLKDWRTTVTIGLSIPVSVVITFLVMYRLGISLNIMSLGGLALGVGMLVDNSIVVLESIFRHKTSATAPGAEVRTGAVDTVNATHTDSTSPAGAAVPAGPNAAVGTTASDADKLRTLRSAVSKGTDEVGRAVVASTLTTVAVFFPLVFVEGIAGQLFKDQALTISSSLLASLLVAITLIPMLSALTVKKPLPLVKTPKAARAEAPAPPHDDSLDAAALAGPRERLWIHVLKSPFRITLRILRLIACPVWWVMRAVGRAVRWIFRKLSRAGLVVARALVNSRAVRFPVQFVGGVLLPLSRAVGAAFRVSTHFLVNKLRGPLSVPVRLFDAGMERFYAWYPGALRSALARKNTVLLGAFGAFALVILLATLLRVELIPPFSQGEFTFNMRFPEGTSILATTRAVSGIEKEVMSLPGVKTVFSTSGSTSLGQFTARIREENIAQITMITTDRSNPEVEEIAIARIRRILDTMPGLTYDLTTPNYFSFRTPIEVEVYGYDLAELREVSGRVEQSLTSIPAIKDISSTMKLGSPEAHIVIDREKLALMNIEPSQAFSALSNALKGEVASRFKREEDKIDILVRNTEEVRQSLNELPSLIIGYNGGFPVQLASVATIGIDRGPAEITRVSQQRAAIVSANLVGHDLAGAASQIRTALRQVPMPPDFSASLGGQSDELRVSFGSLRFALILAIFLVYLVMASQFESFLHPLVILFTLPLATVGVVFSLLITGTSVSVMVLIGVIILAGIVVNNAIVLIDFTNQLRQSGMSKLDAIVKAGQVRMRPILMTTITTVLGLMPMAVAGGEGAELRAPLAITVIGGLSFATMLTLFVIPALYVTLDRSE
ncbi:MAG: efflux RND transporter permease subunit [Candidatus Eisenbacteria bacterium]